MGKGSLFDKVIKIMTHAKDRTPANLDKFDIVVAGTNLGAVLTRNITHFTHGHNTMMAITQDGETPLHSLRFAFEHTLISPLNYFQKTAALLCSSVATSQRMPLEKIDPVKSTVTIKGGRTFEYKNLVLATGLNPDWDAVKGLYEAFHDPAAPVFTNYDSATAPNKYKEFVPMSDNGDIYFYIPPFPFAGEIESMNLLVALDTWALHEKIGLISPLRKVHIINANDRFASKDPLLDTFIRERLSKHDKVEVQFKTKLLEVDSKGKKLVIEGASGAKTVPFNRLYAHVPAKAHGFFEGSDLTAPGALELPVNHKTLQHVKYGNIFGVGDICDLPIQKSFFAGLYQNHVVRHNILEQLYGQPANAEYKGETTFPVWTSINGAVKYSSDYEKGGKFLFDEKLEGLQYSFLFAKKLYKSTSKVMAGKVAGPPNWKLGYQKFKSNVTKEMKAAHHAEHDHDHKDHKDKKHAEQPAHSAN